MHKLILIILLIVGIAVAVNMAQKPQTLQSQADQPKAAEQLEIIKNAIVITQQDGKQIQCVLEDSNSTKIIVCPTNSLEVTTHIKNPDGLVNL